MDLLTNRFYLLIFIVFFPVLLSAQTNTGNETDKNTSFQFKDDTLYSNTGLKIFVGQKLTIGTAAGVDGHYRSVITQKAAIVPSIWGQDMRYENAIENYVDSKRNKEKLKKSLVPGNSVTVKRIVLSKSGKPYFYMVSLALDTDHYNADIKLALILKELLL
jgi:hypothetical protein